MSADARAEALAEFIEVWFDQWAGPGEDWASSDLAAAIDEWQASRPVTDAEVEAGARAAAILGDYDGCFLRIDEWEALEEWEREANPDERPDSDYEDAEFWRSRIRAALDAAREVRS